MTDRHTVAPATAVAEYGKNASTMNAWIVLNAVVSFGADYSPSIRPKHVIVYPIWTAIQCTSACAVQPKISRPIGMMIMPICVRTSWG